MERRTRRRPRTRGCSSARSPARSSAASWAGPSRKASSSVSARCCSATAATTRSRRTSSARRSWRGPATTRARSLMRQVEARQFGSTRPQPGSNWRRSGPPSFAHECRRRMPRRSGEPRRRACPGPERASARRATAQDAAPERRSREGGLQALRRLHPLARPTIAETATLSKDFPTIASILVDLDVGIAVAFARACLETSGSSTCSRTLISNRSSTSASRPMWGRACPTTTTVAAHTRRCDVHGSCTSPSSSWMGKPPSASSATSSPVRAAPSPGGTSNRKTLRPFDQLPVRPRPQDSQRTKARSGKSGCARCCGVVLGTRPDNTACTR